VRFPPSTGIQYIKFEQPASRFALTGVAVAKVGPQGQRVRVAVTGLGFGVVRWQQAEQALTAQFDLAALEPLASASALPEGLEALGDLHASAAYRCHLAQVLLCRCVAELSGSRLPPKAPLMPRAQPTALAAAAATATAGTMHAQGASAP
ncbi:MAG: hypothetical protein NWR15_09315, partial [Limnohabitans sp.]|nr:hypothetical protein [Limnohabitans sp.]